MKTLSIAILISTFSFSAEAVTPYVGISFGKASFDTFCDAIPTNTTCDDMSKPGKLYGGIKLNKNVALEITANDFGNVELATYLPPAQIRKGGKATSIGANLVGIFPINNTFDVFGKVGIHQWNVDIKLTAWVDTTANPPIPPVVGNTTDSGTDISYGAGVSANLTQNVQIRAEVEEIIGATVVSVGAAYLF